MKGRGGLYTDDPKRDPEAEFIPEISASALLERDLTDLPVERAMLEILSRARSVREVCLINGRQRGSLAAVLRGETPARASTARDSATALRRALRAGA